MKLNKEHKGGNKMNKFNLQEFLEISAESNCGSYVQKCNYLEVTKFGKKDLEKCFLENHPFIFSELLSSYCVLRLKGKKYKTKKTFLKNYRDTFLKTKEELASLDVKAFQLTSILDIYMCDNTSLELVTYE